MYDAAGAQQITGLRRQQLADRRARGTILALHTSDGAWLYPAFQFDEGRVKPWVRELLDVFRAGQGPEWWTVAVWMNTPQRELNGLIPVQARRKADRAQVLALASRAASQWVA